MHPRTRPGVTMVLNGGLGNQLSIYATGRSLALTHGCPLYLDTSWYLQGTNRPLELNGLELEATLTSGRGRIVTLMDKALSLFARTCRRIESGASSSYGYRSVTGSQCFVRSDFLVDSRIFQYQPPVRIHAHVHYEYLLPHEKRILFELSNSVQDVLERVIDRIGPWHVGPWIAVHVRQGDYLEPANREQLGLLSPSYYERALTHAKDQGGDAPIVVFSDAPEQALEQLSRFSVAKDVTVSPTGLSDLETFALLSSAPSIITANSTFSWWAAFLEPCGPKQVIAPEPFFRRPDMASSCPPHWRRVTAEWIG